MGYKKEAAKAVPTGPPPPPFFKAKEVGAAIKKHKKGKSPGFDTLTSECIQKLTPTYITALLFLFNLMWALSYTPPSWQVAIIILLYKKGDRMRIGNYRPITLLTTLFNTWERLLTTKLATLTRGIHPPPNQFGSLPHTSDPLAIIVLRALLRMAAKLNLPVYTS